MDIKRAESAEFYYFCPTISNHGEMPEWSNGAVSKTVVRVSAPGVRIPLSPQLWNADDAD